MKIGLRGRAGYTLVEVMVAMAVFAIFMIGILNLLDSSAKVSRIETALADTQENVRFAAYHMMRTARMMGGATMLLAVNVAGTPTWIAGGVANDVSGSFTTPFGTSVAVKEGSDVLMMRGFFEIPPFFVDRSDFSTGSLQVVVRETTSIDGGNTIMNLIGDVDVAGLEGRGVVMMGNLDQSRYVVGQIASGSVLAGVNPNRTLTIPIKAQGSTAAWFWGLNPSGAAMPPNFDVYRIGVFESYVYYVNPALELRRMRADRFGASDLPVATNIGGLQIALGIDANNNGLVDQNEWEQSPTAADAVDSRNIGIRITVLGRTPWQVSGWNEPESTFQIEDADIDDYDRGAKWRRIEVAAALRNFLF